MSERVEIPEAEALVQGYLEGSLSEQESARLRLLLRQDPSAVDQILWGLRDDLLIQAVLAERTVAETARPVEELRPGSQWLKWWAGVMAVLRGKPWAIGTAFGLVAMAVFGLWLSGFSLQMGEPVLAQIDGAGLTLERNGQPIQAREGARLQHGDRLRTADAVAATITFGPEKTRITLRPETDLRIGTFSHGKRFDLLNGKLEASVARQRPFRPMLVKTPQAEARVLGTKFTLTVRPTTTRLDVIEGKVRFTRMGDGASIKVAKDHYSIAGTNIELAALPQTGKILYEYWTNVPGNSKEAVMELKKDRQRFPDHPDKRELLERFEVSPDRDNFVDRFRGYLHPPATGDYVFSVTTDETSNLFLSPSEALDDTILIASSNANEGTRPFNQSAPLTLTAGRCYYIEVIRYGGKGPHHLAVSWQPPGGAREIISGNFLSPFKPQPQ